MDAPGPCPSQGFDVLNLKLFHAWDANTSSEYIDNKTPYDPKSTYMSRDPENLCFSLDMFWGGFGMGIWGEGGEEEKREKKVEGEWKFWGLGF